MMIGADSAPAHYYTPNVCRDLQGLCRGFLQYLQGKSCNIYRFSLQFLQSVNIAGKTCKYYRIFPADIAENSCRVPVNPCKHLQCSTDNNWSPVWLWAHKPKLKCTSFKFHSFYSFGVCCLFIVTATSTTIDQNCTYIQNPIFPSVYSAATALTYTINKCSSDVCSGRLAFETFQIRGPATTLEAANAHNCLDSFVAVVAGPHIWNASKSKRT